jgi:CHAD domain-containing protein
MTLLKQFIRTQSLARLRALSAALRRATRKPDDPDAIHDLRVAIRRFTQCLRTFTPCFDRSVVKKMRRRLRKLMDRCGAARNCDIALDLLREVRLDAGPLAQDLKAQRKSAEKELVRDLQRWRKRKILTDWRENLRINAEDAGDWHLQEDAAHNASRVLPALAGKLFEAGDAAAAANATHDTIHKFRLQAKRFRYTLELFLPLYGTPVERELNALRGLQNTLGSINDCVTTLTLLKGHRRASVAIRGLLDEREAVFRRHWKRHFGSQLRSRWKSSLEAYSGDEAVQ